MKTYIYIYTIIVALVFSSKGNSQVLHSEFETGTFINKFNFIPEMAGANEIGTITNNNSPFTAENNQVFISQIGTGNIIDTDVSSSDAIVNLSQSGHNNIIDIDLEAWRIRYGVEQNGIGNVHMNTANIPTEEVTFDLVQDGNNNTFHSFGANAISNNLKFKMEGESETIIVRNFK